MPAFALWLYSSAKLISAKLLGLSLRAPVVYLHQLLQRRTCLSFLQMRKERKSGRMWHAQPTYVFISIADTTAE